MPDVEKCEDSTDFDFERHLEKVEGGTWLTGYFPTNASGMTIATGYDASQLPDISACLSDTSLWNVLKAFKGLSANKLKNELGKEDSKIIKRLRSASF